MNKKMPKKSKLSTPDWIREGYDSKEDYEKAKGLSKSETGKKEKTFKLRRCPKCHSSEVNVIVGEEVLGKWECKKCNWKGKDIKEEELSEDEFMKFLDEKGEAVA